MKKILLAVDLQKQFKDRGGGYERCLAYIEGHGAEYDKVIATVFRNGRNANYMEALDWKECMDFGEEEGSSQLEFTCDEVLVKYGYGMPVENSRILRARDRSGTTVDVVGCDADACVMAVCFGLWDAGYRFRVLTDYIFTGAGADSGFTKENIIAVMKRNFGRYVR